MRHDTSHKEMKKKWKLKRLQNKLNDKQLYFYLFENLKQQVLWKFFHTKNGYRHRFFLFPCTFVCSGNVSPTQLQMTIIYHCYLLIKFHLQKWITKRNCHVRFWNYIQYLPNCFYWTSLFYLRRRNMNKIPKRKFHYN